ncbi:MAG: UPF0323 family lipoprotein [Campylobacter sp.]|nr:UPF0323 family lipoprotein [Campylobacter sp.]
MKHIKKIASYAVLGGFSAIVMASLSGCGSNNSEDTSQVAVKNGAFVVIEEIEKGKYKVMEEYPSSETRVVLKSLDGSERVLTKEEMDALIAQENAKIDDGTSNLTNPNQAQLSSGGASLGEILLSSAAGAILGSWIGNKLFGNPAFQNQRQNAYKNPSAYSRSVDSFNKAKATNSMAKSNSGKSGFFGSNSAKKSSSFGSSAAS